ncbi:aspartate/glutamate racemase family protein [Roseibacterium sp. SDUM158017]|uniref:maleate cis-trans isomerase family protein n=1 Tax=Roseicyclus salinarum TaxID=3036773 RepID=UPI00241544BF|nr:aspartate/glutamate racemase family protein [Roseibacterium sp. SDUM158017]MDG4649267.1 aspartate/glutamate racemase family protein [Roseibacterium sp. SDUM158017]
MSDFAYRLTPDGEALPRIGIVVLQVDETSEQDLGRLIPGDAVQLHVTRIASGTELTPETIERMGCDLGGAVSLLPDVPFDVIAYACTSGTTLIGPARVEATLRAVRRTTHVTTPLTAALEAFGHVGARSVGIVSPYIATVAGPIRAAFAAAGFEVPVSISFGEKLEANVARIDPESIVAAGLEAARSATVDCLFLSCTNMRTLAVIDRLEAETGLPVLSSNQTLAWHAARLGKFALARSAPGRLLRD